MSKNSRDRQQRAREKIARLRAEEAQRKRRRLWLIGGAAAVLVIAAVVGITLALTGGSPKATPAGGTATPKLQLAALSTLGTLKPAPAPGPLGPEGVPIPAAPPLAGTATAATGQPVDGISCQTSEQTVFHIHAHLTVFVNGLSLIHI